jgi:hypothetical protein
MKPTINYKVNEYFSQQHVQEEIMRGARSEKSSIMPYHKNKWVNFLFKKRPIDDGSTNHYEDASFLYEKNKMLLSLHLLLFVMFDNDQHISKSEKKLLMTFLKRYKKYFQPSDKEKIAAALNETLQLSFISNYLNTQETKKTMFLESIQLIKNTINQLKDYKESFKKLESLSLNLE